MNRTRSRPPAETLAALFAIGLVAAPACTNTNNNAPTGSAGSGGPAGAAAAGGGGASGHGGAAAGTTGAGAAGTTGISGTTGNAAGSGTTGIAGTGGTTGTAGATGSAGAGGATGMVKVGPDPGYLWYAGVELNAFTQAQAAASGDGGPVVTVTPTPSVGTFHDLVFDRAGNLWTIPTSGNQILRLPAAGLGAGAMPNPELIGSSPGLASPQALTFDGSGNLWVLNFAGAGPSTASIVRFDAPQTLSGNMTLTPSVTIAPATDATSLGQFSQGTAICFDAAGSLWFAGVTTVLRIDGPGALHGNVVAAPAAVLSTGEAYSSIAFAANGALWITGTLHGYFALRIDNPGALSGASTPTPAARVALPSGNATFVGGLAFDADGSLWVATSNRVFKVAGPAALVGSVSPTPAVQLDLSAAVSPGLGSKLVFRPPVANLPIY